MTDLVPLSHLVIEGLGGSVFAPPNIDTLAHQLADRGIEITRDDVGRRAVSRDRARALLAEHAAQEERQRAQCTHQTASAVAAIRRAHAARAQLQRELVRENPDMTATEIMMLSDPAADDNLSRAGRRFDAYVNAGRRGLAGFGARFTQPKDK